MGLDTTHNAWHGSYGRFNSFRHELARRIGIDLREYIGYDDDGPKGTKRLEDIDHPLMDLFNHSDCDGELTPEQCKKIADGLDLIIKEAGIDEASDPYSHISYAITFRDGCLEAYSKNENIEFH